MRLAALDVGSNSVKLLVADLKDDSTPVVVYDNAIVTRLSEGLQKSGRLFPLPIRRTVDTIIRMLDEAGVQNPAKVTSIVTAPGRAPNGTDFTEALRAATGIEATIVSGQQEADYTLLATVRAFPDRRPLLMVDVGGASTEFVLASSEAKRSPLSIDLGAVRLTDKAITTAPLPNDELKRARDVARQALADVPSHIGLDGANLGEFTAVLVSGTAPTLSSVHQRLPSYDPEKVHGSVMTKAQLDALLSLLSSLSVEERSVLPGMEPKRADVIMGGVVLVEQIMETLGLSEVRISDRGARWGVLWQAIEVASA